MEHRFRTALCIFVLIGCLQAKPTPASTTRAYMNDFCFELLQEVTCNENVTFKSPSNVLGSCPTAVKTIKEGMKKAVNSCQCSICRSTLDTLQHFTVPASAFNASACLGEKERSLTFNDFVEESKNIIQQINSSP